MVKLSQNFNLSEMVVSQTASRRGIPNTPEQRHIDALRLLAQKVLQPLRDHYDKPIVITSGFRSNALNRAVGGSTTSQHTRGQAADFTIPGVSNLEVCQWMKENLDYDQLIYEFGESGWIHVSYKEPYRNEELSAVRVNGRTKYKPGLG